MANAPLLAVLAASTVATQQLSAPAAPWPLASEQLVFALADVAGPKSITIAYDERGGEPIFNYTLERMGAALLDEHGRLQLEHGSAIAPRQETTLLEWLQPAGEFTLQAFLGEPAADGGEAAADGGEPAAAGGEPDTVLRYGPPHEPNFVLTRQAGMLVLRVRVGAAAEPAMVRVKLPPAADGSHVLATLSAAPPKLQLYIDGLPAAGASATTTADAIRTGLDAWQAGPLSFGSGSHADPGWRGRLEGVAVHALAFSPAQAKRSAAAYRDLRAARRAPESMRLEVELVAKSRVPSPQDIAPYKEGLAVFEYEIRRVTRGFYPVKKLRVAHWVVLGAAALPYGQLELGAIVTLDVQSFDDNPQLANASISDTLEFDFDTELHFDSGSTAIRWRP